MDRAIICLQDVLSLGLLENCAFHSGDFYQEKFTTKNGNEDLCFVLQTTTLTAYRKSLSLEQRVRFITGSFSCFDGRNLSTLSRALKKKWASRKTLLLA